MKFPVRIVFNFLILISSFMLAGCGDLLDRFSRQQTSGETTVFFTAPKQHGLSAMNVLVGGLVVYGVSTDGSFSKSTFLPNEGTGSLSLPNGTYRFLSVGYDAVGLGGLTYCGHGGGASPQTYDLTGTTTTVEIELSTINCTTTGFSSATENDGSNFIAASIVFCGGNTDTSLFDHTSICNTGQESWTFHRGLSNAQINFEQPGSANGYVAYTSNAIAASTFALYSTPMLAPVGTKPEIKVSGPQNTGGVVDYRFSPDGTNIVYVGRDDSTVPQLYVTPYNRQKPMKISGAFSGSLGIKKFEFIDNDTLVFVADKDISNVLELYRVNLDGTDLVKLHPNFSANQSIRVNGSNVSMWPNPNGNEIVFIADAGDTDEEYVMYITDSTAPSQPGALTVGIAPVTGGDADYGDFTPDGAKFILRGDMTLNEQFEVYAYTFSTSSSMKISGDNAIPNCDSDNNAADRVHDVSVHTNYGANGNNEGTGKVFYLISNGVSGPKVLCSVDPDGTDTAILSNVVGSTSADGAQRFRFNASGTKIIWVENDGSPDFKKRLWINNIGGGALQELTPPGGGLGPGRGVPMAAPYDTLYEGVFEISRDESRVIYISDEGGSTDYRLISVAIDGSDRVTLLDPIQASGNVLRFKFAGVSENYVAILADSEVDLKNELYLSPMATSTLTKISDTTGTDKAVFKFEPLYGRNEILYVANLENPGGGFSGAQQGYIADFSGNTRYVAMTHSAVAGTPTMSGRFQVHLMQGILGGFGQNPSLSPAISSGCLVGITSEGDATGSTFRLPTGTNSSLLPMAVAVDIYPRKQTCTGSFIRKIFPFGISSQPLVGSSLLSGNGSQLRLFILD